MRFIEVLCEGSSDVPVLVEILQRQFGLSRGEHFQVHPHRGKGKLPKKEHLLKPPNSSDNSLLCQLPIKLKNMGRQAHGDFEVAVVVVIDADDDDCAMLKKSLLEMYDALPTKPPRCLFRIAVEETESWFIADTLAVKKAYPKADVAMLSKIDKDAICGAWEKLATSLKLDPAGYAGGEKSEWATAISPHLNLKKPESPSLKALVSGVEKLLS